jgi:hypothetical protein
MSLSGFYPHSRSIYIQSGVQNQQVVWGEPSLLRFIVKIM